jgi:hypothetical protein
LRVEKVSEKEEKERQRAETANKRKTRVDRRRADGMGPPTHVEVPGAHADADSDPSEEIPLATRAAAHKAAQASGPSNAAVPTAPEVVRPPPAVAEPPPASNPAPDTPPTITVQTKADKKRSHKKKGRNQYTRDRDAHDDESPARSQSRDIQKDDHGPPNTGGKAAAAESGSSSKANAKSRGGMNSKITMNDMKRRATALLDFISRTQVELAGESPTGTASGSESGANGSSAAAGVDKAENGASNSAPVLVLGEPGNAALGKEFKELGCVEMMDSLTRRLVKWQQQYAV